MIDLYTWGTPNGRKVSIALEEMGLDYTVHPVDITNGEQNDPAFLRIAPNNKIPAIVDHDVDITLMESGAILLHLAEKSGLLLPSERKARLETIEWLMWQMGGFGPMLGQAHQYLKFHKGKAPFAEERFAKEVARLYRVLDTRLGEAGFVAAGQYTVADIAVWPWVSRYEWQGVSLDDYPNVKRWYCSLAEREGVRAGYHVPSYTQDIPLP